MGRSPVKPKEEKEIEQWFLKQIWPESTINKKKKK